MLILVQNEVHTYLNVKPKTKSSFKKKKKRKSLWPMVRQRFLRYSPKHITHRKWINWTSPELKTAL